LPLPLQDVLAADGASPPHCRSLSRGPTAPRALDLLAGLPVGPQEVAAIAESTESQVAEIFEVAGTMFGVTLIGLALGFVLLRVEAAVEDGSI